MSIIVEMIKKFLAKFDVGIYRISAMKPTAQGIEVNDPIKHNEIETLDKFYDSPDAVKEYMSVDRVRFYDSLIDMLITEKLITDDMDIADVGCGPGVLLAKIGEKFSFRSLTGFEYSIKAIEVARGICPTGRFVHFDIYKGSSDRFDLILCTEVLEHLIDPIKAMATMIAMLQTNGTLVITVPNGRTDTFLGHINFWSPEGWKEFIRKQCQEIPFETGVMASGHNYAVIRNI